MSEEKIVKVNYAGNSHRERDAKKAEETPKAEEPKVQKIEGINAVRRKKPLGRKIAETFNGDDMESVGSYVVFEVLLPALKNMVFDAASQGLERKLFGSSSPRTSSSRPKQSTYVPYNKMTSNSSRPESKELSRRSRATHDYDDLILETRGQAEEILEGLRDLISEYEVAKVADMYEMVGITAEFTDQRWGWNDLRDARARMTRGGYVLELPKPVQID